MGNRDSVGAVAISIPVITCMAGMMALQSVDVRRGYTPPPQVIPEHERSDLDLHARRSSSFATSESVAGKSNRLANEFIETNRLH